MTQYELSVTASPNDQDMEQEDEQLEQQEDEQLEQEESARYVWGRDVCIYVCIIHLLIYASFHPQKTKG